MREELRKSDMDEVKLGAELISAKIPEVTSAQGMLATNAFP